MGVQELDHRSECVAGQQSVAIQMACVAAASHTHPDIVIARIQPPFWIPHQGDLRKQRRDHVCTGVGRGIIDADYFEANAFGELIHRFQAASQQITGVITGNNDG